MDSTPEEDRMMDEQGHRQDLQDSALVRDQVLRENEALLARLRALDILAEVGGEG
jgi:hypothetical protein